MTVVRLDLRGNIDAHRLRCIVRGFLDDCGEMLPARVEVDFSRLTFVRPLGVTFLSNLLDWLTQKGVTVTLVGLGGNGAAISFLDDSLFFERHAGKKLFARSRPRSTTLPLISIAHESSHQWLRQDLIPWLTSTLGMNKASLYPFQSCLGEIFNNINDHSMMSIGSVFVQHFPKENAVRICVADFGVGIPSTVRRIHPDLDDNQAILAAVKRGFTSRSTRANAGIGLDELLNSVVRTNGGEVHILSLRGYVAFSNVRGSIRPIASQALGFCPGTIITMTMRTDTIRQLGDEREDLEW